MDNNTNQPIPEVPTTNPVEPTPIPNIPPAPENNSNSIFNNKTFIMAGVVIFAFVGVLLFLRIIFFPSNDSSSEVTVIEETIQATPADALPTTSIPNTSPIPSSIKITSTLVPSMKPSATPTNKPAATNTPTPTKTPTPTPGSPPQMAISFPYEGQSVVMDSSMTFCVVDAPIANVQGLERRHNTGSGWTSYAPHTTLCYSPSNGANTLEQQYRNSSGLESQVYTTHFNFQRI